MTGVALFIIIMYYITSNRIFKLIDLMILTYHILLWNKNYMSF